MGSVALVVVYNHRYDANIGIIEGLYSERFTSIFHLVPFYNGDRPNVIPVYESSFQFQGYIAQGLKHFYRQEFEHYLFIADDLVLNPVISEGNYCGHLGLDAVSSFIPHLISLHEMRNYWPRTREACEFTINKKGVEITNELPGYDEAQIRFATHGLEIRPLRYWQVFPSHGFLVKNWVRMIFRKQKQLFHFLSDGIMKWQYNLPYPLAGSYSDICAVSAGTIKIFGHYCGVFASAGLHAELAIPTSLILSADHIITEKDLSLRGRALWPNGWNRLHGENDLAHDELKELDKYNNDLNTLLQNFPAGYLYLHPVKLSKWKSLAR
jgi:hypothetical protein